VAELSPWILGGGLAMLAVLAIAGVGAATPLFEPTSLNGDGVVTVDGSTPADPAGLAAGAGLTDSTYALARMIDSEFRKYRDARIGAAWACRNMAQHVGKSVVDLLTHQRIKQQQTDSDGNPVTDDNGNAVYERVAGPGDGFFGTQHGRYASTAQDAGAEAREIAKGVMSGDIPDNTGGARQFDSPQAFGAQLGTVLGGADDVAAKRLAAGDVEVDLPGVPSSYARFWRPA
jgi:hypothetical protein